MGINEDVLAIASKCREVLDWANLDTYSKYETYSSLPLMILDAVFSINAKYEQVVIPVIKRYCDYVLRTYGFDPNHMEQSVDDFVNIGAELTAARFASEVLRNKQRTSTRGGILKAEAALQFAQVLIDFDVHRQSDKELIVNNDRFCRWIRTIPGQTISLDYFLMMIGRDDLIKADRRVLCFLKDCLNRPVEAVEAFRLLTKTTNELQKFYDSLTPRVLDHMIWRYKNEN